MGWKSEALGISSEDSYGIDRSGVRSLYGSKWRFQDKKSHTALKSEQEKQASAPKAASSSAPAVPGAPVEAGVTAAEAGDGMKKYKIGELSQMRKEDLQEVAASLGIVNLEAPKKDLIEQIMVKQG